MNFGQYRLFSLYAALNLLGSILNYSEPVLKWTKYKTTFMMSPSSIHIRHGVRVTSDCAEYT